MVRTLPAEPLGALAPELLGPLLLSMNSLSGKSVITHFPLRSIKMAIFNHKATDAGCKRFNITLTPPKCRISHLII
jgi:hypothetical protein